MDEPIHELIDQLVDYFDLTESDLTHRGWYLLSISRKDVARLVFHIKRLESTVDSYVLADDRPRLEAVTS
jgi:hypothetical protein